MAGASTSEKGTGEGGRERDTHTLFVGPHPTLGAGGSSYSVPDSVLDTMGTAPHTPALSP